MEKQIKLSLSDIKKFVAVTTQCDFDIDISYNRYTVDAKSFLGLVGLDLQHPLTVKYDGFNQKLEAYLDVFNVKV